MRNWCDNDSLYHGTGPVINVDGSQMWYLNGRLHRVDGPAVIHADGSLYWYVNDQLHRTDGPAATYAYGSDRWFLNGIHVTEDVNQWMDKLDITYPFDEEQQALFLLTFGGG